MRRLRVTSFSSIANADLTFRSVTVIIGPQASGKSVLCKLNYFFLSLFNDEVRMLSEVAPLEHFKYAIEEKFFRWFPLGTWGAEQFSIQFSVGNHEVKLVRSKYAGAVSDRFRVKLSPSWELNYNRVLATIPQILQSSNDREANFMAGFKVQHAIESDLRTSLGNDYVGSQLFIPAARSFFTNLGRAIAVFANNDSLDPLTFEFGQYFAARLESRSPPLRGQTSVADYLEEVTSNLLKGRLVREGSKNFLVSADGRKIPVSALSSGQQELLPLLRTLPRGRNSEGQICYIEEPEAHLFPDAQSYLIEALTTLINMLENSVQLILTTHSPYVLAKFNNLIKAGSVGSNEPMARSIKAIIPERSWLPKDHLIAFAICDGELVNITEGDGSINGDYIDGVSDKNADEFSRLLEVEYGT